jgi:hypothetical protein
MEAQAIFLNMFTVCSLCHESLSFVIFDKETNGSYPFANRLNGLAHLCKLISFCNQWDSPLLWWWKTWDSEL